MSDVVLITGASSGIGLATAKLFAQNHYSVIITGRREKRLKDFAAEMKKMYNTEVFSLKMDVSKYSDVKAGIESLDGDWKNIKILINNAGLALGLNYIHEGDIEDWEHMIDTNLKGLLYVSREVVPGMIARGAGHIINIGSIAGRETYLKGNVYCATKHGVDSITKALRIELVKYGIRVTQIAPGAVETEFSKVRYKGDDEMAAKVYQGFLALQPEDVAGAIYFAATLPQHVCVNDMLIMPTAQADTVHWNR
jgi:3-hydroxy acid dehydrogenase / malonic semialdehyde reductase